MSSYTDPILTKQGYRSLGTNSDFFMNLSVDNPSKFSILTYDGLNWKPTYLLPDSIVNSSITWSKLQNFSAHSRLLGCRNNSFAPEEITLGSGLEMSGNVLSATNLSLGVVVRNQTGTTLTKGSAVRISGATGNKPLVSLARADAYATTEVIGILESDISNNGTGIAILYGEITNINTNNLVAGQSVYLSPTVAGGLTATEPDPPNFQVQIGFCEVVNNNNGKLIVSIRHEFTKSEYIADSTTVGRALLTAVDATAAKNTLGVEKNTNVTIGPTAGATLGSGAVNNVLIGQGAGDLITGSNGSVAVGLNSLGQHTTAAAGISNTTAGSGGTASATITGVTLEKDSGAGTMTVYPTVTLTTNSSGAVTSVVLDAANRGSGASGQPVVLKATANGIALGAPANWRGTVSNFSVNTAVGKETLNNNTTGSGNSAFGWAAMFSNTTGDNNTALSFNSMYGNTTGRANTVVGVSALRRNTTGANNAAFGVIALDGNTTGSNNVGVGYLAGAYKNASPSTDLNTVTDNSVFIGYQSRAADSGQTNQVVIGGINALGNGSNTTTLNNTDTTATYIAGTATSLFSIAGDTMRIVGTRNPASNAAGTAGDFCFGTDGGTTYLYYCIANANWGRVALTTGY